MGSPNNNMKLSTPQPSPCRKMDSREIQREEGTMDDASWAPLSVSPTFDSSSGSTSYTAPPMQIVIPSHRPTTSRSLQQDDLPENNVNSAHRALVPDEDDHHDDDDDASSTLGEGSSSASSGVDDSSASSSVTSSQEEHPDPSPRERRRLRFDDDDDEDDDLDERDVDAHARETNRRLGGDRNHTKSRSSSLFARMGFPNNHKKSSSNTSVQTDQAVRTRSRRRSSIVEIPTHCFRYAVLVWILELVLVLTLKNCGVIEREFDPLNQFMNNMGDMPFFGGAVGNETNPLAILVQRGMSLWGNESSGGMMQSLSYMTQEQKRPGYQMAQKGAQAHYPFVLVPGFVTSGLEVWGGEACAKKHFRQRMWTAMNSARSFLSDRDCWKRHMMLDPETGGDPENIRLRAANGFEAVDYFLANYWVFGKIIENLADVGYTPSDMTVAPYDWRVAFPILESRDGYFTKLQYKIEAMVKTNGKKVVLTSHSMGVLVVHYFFAWVTSEENGGRNWVDDHIHAYVNIAGAHLGVPKALTALLSGEMSDTVIMNPMATAVEQFFGRQVRRELWNTWGSLWAMFPKGGDRLWNGADMCQSDRNLQSQVEQMCNASLSNETNVTFLNSTGEVADDCNATPEIEAYDSNDNKEVKPDPLCPAEKEKKRSRTISPMLSMTDSQEWIDKVVGDMRGKIMSRRRSTLHHLQDDSHHHEHSKSNNETGVSPAIRHFLAHGGYSVTSVIDLAKALSHGIFEGKTMANAELYNFYASGKPTANRHSEKSWHDPTQTPLPHAPNMKIYCLYGVGKPTERAYYYKTNSPDSKHDGADPDTNETKPMLLTPPIVLDSSVTDTSQNVEHGVRYTDGDGSVPLLSLGYLCTDAWQRKSSGLNPSRIPVVTREYKHSPEFSVDDPMRSGPHSGDHVDVLGNIDLNHDLLRILTDFELEEVNQNNIISDIEHISRAINAKKGGGI